MLKKRRKRYYTICILALVVQALVLFAANRHIHFVLDDIWYATNLVTGEKLASFGDVIESQIWHYNNWGGRSVTHGILQLIIMSGELFADILNTIMVFALAYMIILVADTKNLSAYVTAVIMITALNANTNSSMFWESGSVNYLYSTTWILLFMYPYVRCIRTGEKLSNLNILWLIPLGIMTGWSNENMGPAVFCFTIMAIVYLAKWKKEKPGIWMFVGCVSSLIGSMFVIVAPGNFVRNDAIEKSGLLETIENRFMQELTAGANYLLPSFVLLSVMAVAFLAFYSKNISAVGIMIIITMVLSFGAMILSPHYPDRATFGTMIFCIIEMISLGSRAIKESNYKKALVIVNVLLFIMSVLNILNGGGMFSEI